MEQIRLIVEQKIANLRQYETEYRKALQHDLNDSNNPFHGDTLRRLDSKISAIKSWLSLLSPEEHFTVIACVADQKPLPKIVRMFGLSFGAVPIGQEQMIYLYKESGIGKIVKYLYDEYGDAYSLSKSME